MAGYETQDEATQFNRELNVPDLEIKLNEPTAEYERQIKQKAKQKALKQLQS